MHWRQVAVGMLAGVCSSALWGCSECRGPLDCGTLRQEPTAAVLPVEAGPDPAVSPQNPPAAQPAPAVAAKASAKPQDASLDGQIALARLCERRGENEQAEGLYRALLKKAPRDPRPHHRLAVMAVQKNDLAQAEEHFRAARSLAPPSAELFSDLGYCYYLRHQLKEAEDILNQALKLEPNHAAAVNNLALVVGAQGRFDESLALFKRANSEAKAYANLAYVFAQHGELAWAEETYSRALTLDNKMRAAAQAMLQVAERRQAQERLASAAREPARVFPPPDAVDAGAQGGGSQVVKASLEVPCSGQAVDRMAPRP